MKRTCIDYCNKKNIKVFARGTNGPEFVSLKYSILGEQEAVLAAKLSNQPWATAWWRPNKSEVAVIPVKRGQPTGWRQEGKPGDYGICGEAASFLKNLNKSPNMGL